MTTQNEIKLTKNELMTLFLAMATYRHELDNPLRGTSNQIRKSKATRLMNKIEMASIAAKY